FALIVVGLVEAAGHGFRPTPVVGVEPIARITVVLVLRAFSSGATAMTGIEGDLQRRARLPAAIVAQRAHRPHGHGRPAGRDVRRPCRADAPGWRRPAPRRDRAVAVGPSQLRFWAAVCLCADRYGARVVARRQYRVQRLPPPAVVHGRDWTRAAVVPA